MRGVGTGGDGVEFTAYYFLRKAKGAESFVIWDASVGVVEVEIFGFLCRLFLEINPLI